MYNEMTIEQLKGAYPKVDWEALLDAAIPEDPLDLQDTVVVPAPSYLAGLNEKIDDGTIDPTVAGEHYKLTYSFMNHYHYKYCINSRPFLPQPTTFTSAV
jgi:hypothetical protein